MSDTPDPLLDAIARISEGQPVDWDALDRLAVTESFRQRLDELKVIAGVADLARKTPAEDGDRAGRLKPAPPDEPVGVTWAHLRILEQIGRGAFGEVYRAWDTKLDREVALKLIRARADDDDERHTPTIEEGRLLARVRHANVVTVYGADQIGGSTGIWMEFVRGETLDQLIRRTGPLEPDDVVRTGVDLTRALAAVHAVGLLHRDIKAPNVVREDGGRLVLMDFGSVVEHDRGTGSDGSLAGTPLYLAPEVMRGEQPTVRSDIYAVGVLLYYLATGEFPIRAKTFDEVRQAVVAGETIPIAQVRQKLPAGLVRVIEKSMERNPWDRFESAEAMEAALTALLPRTSPARWPFAFGGALAVIAVILTAAWYGGLPPFGSSSRAKSLSQLVADGADWGRLTADGRYQACPDYGRDYWTVNLAVCDLSRRTSQLVTLSAKRGTPGESLWIQPTISPSGRKIAYLWNQRIRLEDGSEETHRSLRVISTGGGAEPKVLLEFGPAAFPAATPSDWTADESQILVVWYEARDDVRLELVDVETGRRDVLRTFQQVPVLPRLSPDGGLVLYSLRRDGLVSNDLFLLDTRSGAEWPLVEHPADDNHAIWSPSGDSVVFVSDRDGTLALWRLAVRDGQPEGEPELLHQFSRENMIRPLGFRGPDAIVYWAHTGGLDVFTAPLDLDAGRVGPATRALRDPLTFSASPAWSPDGSRLAYVASRAVRSTSRDPHIIVQDANTQDVLMEVRAPGSDVNGQHLDWTHDGQSLLVLAARALHLIDASTGQTYRTLPEWFSDGRFARSPDGTFVGVRIDRVARPPTRRVMRLDWVSGEATEVGRLEVGGGHAQSLVLSPDGQEMAFTRAFGPADVGPFEHIIVPIDGSGHAAVGQQVSRYCRVEAWIERTLIVACHITPLYSRFDWSASLFALPLDGGGYTRLGLDMPQLLQVKVHPDGRRIAFTAGEDNNEIWAIENLPPIRRR